MGKIADDVEKNIKRMFAEVCEVDAVNIMKGNVAGHVETGNLIGSIGAKKLGDYEYEVGTFGCNHAKALEYGRKPSVSKYPYGPKLYGNTTFFRQIGHPVRYTGEAEGIHFAQKTAQELGG